MNVRSSLVFEDETFSSYDWHSFTHRFVTQKKNSQHDDNAKFVCEHISTGGYKGGSFRQVIHQWGSRKVSQNAYISVVHLMKNSHYFKIPNTGDIRINAHMKIMTIIGDIVYGLIIEQDGLYYLGPIVALKFKSEEGKWKSFDFNDLSFENFTLLTMDKEIDILKKNPVEEKPVRFGCISVNSTQKKKSLTVSGIGHFKIEIVTKGNLGELVVDSLEQERRRLKKKIIELTEINEKQNIKISDLECEVQNKKEKEKTSKKSKKKPKNVLSVSKRNSEEKIPKFKSKDKRIVNPISVESDENEIDDDDDLKDFVVIDFVNLKNLKGKKEKEKEIKEHLEKKEDFEDDDDEKDLNFEMDITKSLSDLNKQGNGPHEENYDDWEVLPLKFTFCEEKIINPENEL